MIPHLDQASRVRPAPNVHWRELGAEIVLLDFARGEYFALDEVGAHLWREIEQAKTIGEMVSTLRNRYDVSGSDPEHDVLTLMQELLQRSLIALD